MITAPNQAGLPWRDEDGGVGKASDVVGHIRLAPDPSLVKTLGANHTFESAIADLVDNSIDAGATRISIRLLTHDDRLVQVEVVDNGRGMNGTTIDAAMTIGRGRAYTPGDVGHFGIGLKSASLGSCDVLAVWSSNGSAKPVGRRIRALDYSQDFSCEILAADAAADRANQRASIVGRKVGTTVVWTEVKAYRGNSNEEARNWLAKCTERLRAHLGVTYHRMLADKRVSIDMVEDDVVHEEGAIGVPVPAINPFGYRVSGHPKYPKTIVASVRRRKVKMVCHIWPPKSDVTGYRIGGKPGTDFQGFYIYRNDRLLQIGGWSDSATSSPKRQLARIVLEDDQTLDQYLTMNPEKSGLKFEPAFHDALGKAKSPSGTTFLDYLQDAEIVAAESNKRQRTRKPVIPPGKGFPPALHRRIKAELPFLFGDELHIKWKRLPIGEFLDFDYAARTVWLNQRYRTLFAPQGGSMNDSPVVKSLLFLLTHELFEGQHLGARDKDQIALWTSVLGAAVVAEEKLHDQ